MLKSGKKVYVLALNEVVAGFQPHNDNLPPDKNDILSFLKLNE